MYQNQISHLLIWSNFWTMAAVRLLLCFLVFSSGIHLTYTVTDPRDGKNFIIKTESDPVFKLNELIYYLLQILQIFTHKFIFYVETTRFRWIYVPFNNNVIMNKSELGWFQLQYFDHWKTSGKIRRLVGRNQMILVEHLGKV